MQLRLGGMGTPIGLDFGAVMAVGAHRDLDMELLSEVLPSVETAILSGFDPDDSNDTVGDPTGDQV